MPKVFSLILVLLSLQLSAQYSIKGAIDPDHDYSWILLYKVEKGTQTYLDNADVVEGEFEFEIDDNATAGIYRAYYQIENNRYVEFIYNKENINFSFDPNDPEGSIFFSESEENKVYQDYYRTIKDQQETLDSLQVAFFNAKSKKQQAQLTENYATEWSSFQDKQSAFEQRSEGKWAYHFIKGSKQFNPSQPIADPQEYLNSIKSHFFDSLDLNDPVLRQSSFINDRLRDFVFYLHQDKDPAEENRLQKEAIDKAHAWIGDDKEVAQQFEEMLIEQYMEDENGEMIEYVDFRYYSQLPKDMQNEQFRFKMEATLRTAIGSKAPDFIWNDEGVEKNLHGLVGTDYYVLMFFSSSCPHCQIEAPDFYKFISGIHNIRVVAIGLEDEEGPWKEMTAEFKEFINILDLQKWSSPKVKDYGIEAIPSYFVLDANKRILAKPYDLSELKSLFEER